MLLPIKSIQASGWMVISRSAMAIFADEDIQLVIVPPVGYEWDDHKDCEPGGGFEKFDLDGGICGDGVIKHLEVTDCYEDAPMFVDFTSEVFADAIRGIRRDGMLRVRRHRQRQEWRKSSKTYSPQENPPEELAGISWFGLCSSVCFQDDLVEGETLEDLSTTVNEEDRLIGFRWGRAVDPDDEGADEGYLVPYTTENDCTITDAQIEFEYTEKKSIAKFNADSPEGEVIEDAELALVSYVASCPPEFVEALAHTQKKFDVDDETEDTEIGDAEDDPSFAHELRIRLPETNDNVTALGLLRPGKRPGVGGPSPS